MFYGQGIANNGYKWGFPHEGNKKMEGAYHIVIDDPTAESAIHLSLLRQVHPTDIHSCLDSFYRNINKKIFFKKVIFAFLIIIGAADRISQVLISFIVHIKKLFGFGEHNRNRFFDT